jgi:acetyl-CoA carboxylase biotin carboxyl carrier protein
MSADVSPVQTSKMTKESKKTSGEQTLIRELAGLLDETGLTEIELEKSGLKIRVARNIQANVVAQSMAPAAATVASVQQRPSEAAQITEADAANHPGAVKSPMVGTIYRSPEPGAPHFVDVGTTVTAGQTLLIIEAMKTMNHIPAPRAGTITRILVEDNQPVEYGEPLVIIE